MILTANVKIYIFFNFFDNYYIECHYSCKACTGPLALDCRKDACLGNYTYEVNKGCVCQSWQNDDIASHNCYSKFLILINILKL